MGAVAGLKWKWEHILPSCTMSIVYAGMAYDAHETFGKYHRHYTSIRECLFYTQSERYAWTQPACGAAAGFVAAIQVTRS